MLGDKRRALHIAIPKSPLPYSSITLLYHSFIIPLLLWYIHHQSILPPKKRQSFPILTIHINKAISQRASILGVNHSLYYFTVFFEFLSPTVWAVVCKETKIGYTEAVCSLQGLVMEEEAGMRKQRCIHSSSVDGSEMGFWQSGQRSIRSKETDPSQIVLSTPPVKELRFELDVVLIVFPSLLIPSLFGVNVTDVSSSDVIRSDSLGVLGGVLEGGGVCNTPPFLLPSSFPPLFFPLPSLHPLSIYIPIINLP